MFSSELNMVIAQNCQSYHPRYLYSSMSLGTSSESCTNCKNYLRGKCIKDLKDGLAERISLH